MGEAVEGMVVDAPLPLAMMEPREVASPGGSSLVSTVPSAAGEAGGMTPYELTDREVTSLAIAQGDATALAATAPFPMTTSLLQHLQEENKWQRKQLREMQKQVEKSENAAVTSLRSSEQRSRQLLRQLREEQDRREAAERTASKAASKVKDMHDEVTRHKVAAERAQESERQMKRELLRTQQEAENFLKKATEAREAQMHAEQQQRYAEEETERLRVDMHGLEARAAMMRGRLDDIDAAKMLVHEQGMRTAAATVIASAWRGRADRKLAFRALELKSATMMQAHWRRYSARAEFRARLRMAQRNRQITQLQMAAGMLEQGRAHVLLLREKMAQEQKEREELELAAAREALQGWDGKLKVTIAIPAFIGGIPEDEVLGGFKCLPAKRLSDVRDMVDEELDDTPDDWVFMLQHEPILDSFDEADHTVEEYLKDGAQPDDVVADREVILYIQNRLIADPQPVIEDKVEEPIEEEPPYGVEHEAAAIRIQCRFRGRQARRWKAEQDAAAARIQARFRGNRYRASARTQQVEESDEDENLDDLEQMIYKQLGKKLARNALTKPGDGPGEDKKVTGPTAVDREMDGSGVGEDMGIIVKLQELIAAAKGRYEEDKKLLSGRLAGSEAVAASTRQNAKNALKENHTKLTEDADAALQELLQANEDTRKKSNEHFDEMTSQIKQVHAVLATLAIGMSEHTQLMGILDAMEANALKGLGDAKSGHNGLTGLLQDAHRRVTKNGQNFHDDLSDAAGRMHDEMLEKIELLNTHGVELNEKYRAEMNMTLKSQLGLMQKTVEQMRIRGEGLENDLADTNASLERTKADLVQKTGEACKLKEWLDSSVKETNGLKEETLAQAEKEQKLVEENEDMEHRLKIQEGTLSSQAQALVVARIRATNATIAESQSALLKGQLCAVLELLRMRREVHHGTMMGLEKPRTREIMEHVNYLVSVGQPYPMGLDPLYKAEEQRYGGDIRTGMLRLKARVKTVSTAVGPMNSLEIAVVAPGLEEVQDEFVSSELKIEPWATEITIDQSDPSNQKLPLCLPEDFEPEYYIDGEATDMKTYCNAVRKHRLPEVPSDAYVVAKATNGLIEATEEYLSFRFTTDRQLFYIDPLAGSDHNPGSDQYPFQTVLHAAQQAAKPEVVKDVRVLMRDQAADALVLTLPAIIIAVIAEEAMHAPLPDGWERQIKNGNTYYFNKWLAGRAPTYAHPMDTDFRRLCQELLKLEREVAQQYRDHQAQLDKLPEYPSAVYIRESTHADGTVTEEVKASKWTKGGSLSQFLDEAALGEFYEEIAAKGARMPQDLQELAKDETELDKLGMLRLEKLRFKRVVETAFPEVMLEQVEAEHAPQPTLQIENKPDIQEVVTERQVLVVAAKGLRKADSRGKSDPYAVVYVDNEKIGQTDFLSKTLDPHWEAEFPVQISQTYVDGRLEGHRGAKIRVEIFDHDLSSAHDFLGQVELYSVEYSDDLTIPIVTTELRNRGSKQGKITGELTLALQDPTTVRPTVKRQLVVASATGLQAADRKLFGEGVSDPYAIIYWNDVEIARTEVEKQTLEPVWETRVMLTIPDRGGVLRVEVFDHDVGSAHDFLGQVEQHVGPGGKCNWDWDPDELELQSTNFQLHPRKDAQGSAADAVQGSLTLRVENPILRRLVVMQAVGLRAADKKTSDPYAVVYWQNRELGQTKVVGKTLDPIWEADFELPVDPRIGEGTLCIKIFDHDIGSKSDFLGQIEVELGGDNYGGPGIVMHRRAFPLQPDPRKPAERIPGAVVFRIEDPTGGMTPELQEYDGSVRPATPQGMLEVTLVEARNLKKMDLVGKNDPYVVITVEGRTMRSTTIDGGGSKPSWCTDGGGGEVLEFEVEQAVAVELAVYDEDQDADDLIGTAIVELDHAPENQDWALEDWFDIEDKKGKTTGAVHLQISWAQQRDREAMQRSLLRTQELHQLGGPMA